MGLLHCNVLSPDRRLIVFIVAGLFLLFSLPSVWADTGEEDTDHDSVVMELDRIVVDATRGSVSVFSVPGSAVLIGSEESYRAQATDVKDLINSVVNVDFDNPAIGPIQRPSVRGLDQNQIIMKVDGVRQTYRGTGGIAPNPLQIDPALLKQVEIVRGPSSVLHGSGGIGGVIAVTTIDASDKLLEDQKLGFSSRSGYSTALSQFSQVASVYGRFGIVDIIGSGTYRLYGDAKNSDPDGDRTSKREGQNISSLFKVSLFPGDYQYGSASLITDNDSLERNGVTYSTTQQRLHGSWSLEPESVLSGLHLNTSYTNCINTYDNNIRDLEDRFTSFGLDLYGSTEGTIGSFGSWEVTMGGDLSLDHQEGTDQGVPDPGRPDADARDFGFFARLDLGLFESLHVIPSARYSYYSRKGDSSTAPDQSDSRLSPQIAVQWMPASWLHLFGSYADTYRAPSIDEIYFEMEYTPLIRVVANPDLKPEIARTYEVGLGLSFDNLIATGDSLRFKAAAFSESVKDFIGADGPFMNGVVMEYMSVNAGEVSRWGVELESGYRIDSYSIDVAYGFIKGEDEDSGEEKGSVPQNLVVSLGAEIPRFGLAFFWNSKFVSKSDYVLFSALDSIPAYNVHGIGIAWIPEADGFLGNSRFDLSVNNVFDSEYVTYRGGPDTARDVRISAAFSF
jgi:hemoglobin/transferrin/lactoferrin receptor protein